MLNICLLGYKHNKKLQSNELNIKNHLKNSIHEVRLGTNLHFPDDHQSLGRTRIGFCVGSQGEWTTEKGEKQEN